MDKSKKELAREAREEQREEVTARRLALLAALADLDDLGGKDDYVQSLHVVVQNFPEGIALNKLRNVFADQQALTAAREKLEGTKITETKIGAAVVLMPILAEPATA